MNIGKGIAVAAVAALMAASPAFAANSTGTAVVGAKLGQSVARSSSAKGEHKLASGAILPLVIAGAIVVGSVVVIATDDDNADSPA